MYVLFKITITCCIVVEIVYSCGGIHFTRSCKECEKFGKEFCASDCGYKYEIPNNKTSAPLCVPRGIHLLFKCIQLFLSLFTLCFILSYLQLWNSNVGVINRTFVCHNPVDLQRHCLIFWTKVLGKCLFWNPEPLVTPKEHRYMSFHNCPLTDL